MGAASGHAVAVHLSTQWSKPSGGRESTDQHARHGGGLTLQNRTRTGQRTDIPAGTAGQTAQTARSGAGCGKGRWVGARVDCGEMGGVP